MNKYPDQNGNDNSPKIAIQDFNILSSDGSIAARLYQPKGIALPIVLYFHGGGFVSGSIEDADVPAHFIAEHCSAVVLSVAYSLAPARPFPAAPEDAFHAFSWATRNGSQIGGDSKRFAVAGDDAGGNLAACLSMMVRDRNAGSMAAQVLIGPMLDPSMTRLGDAGSLKSDVTAEKCAACYRQYLPNMMQRMHPYAAPLESWRLAGLPSALIITAEYDVLHNEAEKYASSLIEAGVHTQVSRYAGVTHTGLHRYTPVLHEVSEFLKRHLWPSSSQPFSRHSL